MNRYLLLFTALLFFCGTVENTEEGEWRKYAGHWAYTDTLTDVQHNWRFRKDTLQRNREEIQSGSKTPKMVEFWKVDTDTLKFWKPPNCLPVFGGDGYVCDPVDTVKYRIRMDEEGRMHLTNSDSTLTLIRVN